MAKKQAPQTSSTPVDKDILKIQTESAKAGREAKKTAQDLAALDKGRYKSNRELKKALQEIKDIERDIFDVSKELNANEVARLGLQRQLTADKIKSLKNDQAAGLLARKNLKQTIESAKKIKEISDIEAKALPHRKKLLEAQKKLNAFQDKYKHSVSESLGFVDKIDDAIKEIPIVGDFLSKSLGTDKLKEELESKVGASLENVFMKGTVKAKEASESAIAGYDSQINKLNGVEDAASGIVGELGSMASSAGGVAEGAAGMEAGLIGAEGAALGASAALGPLLPIALAIAAAVMLFKKALEIDQEVTDLAKGLGTSKQEATELHHELQAIALETKVIGASEHALVAAYEEVAKSIGVSKLASKEMAETQVYLTKQLGMAGEAAVDFQNFSKANGRTAYQNLEVIKAGVESMTGGMMNYQEVASDIAKTSKAVQAAYKGNIKELVKATIQAKKFGMTLDQTADQAEKLLDFESSIEAEMKANVLTGKSMNMNQARMLALQGKSAEASAEAIKQAGSYDDILNMNVMQQKAVAEAAGLTVDQLVAAAEHEKTINNLAKDLNITLDENGKMSEADLQRAMASTNEEAKRLAMEQQRTSAQEKINALTDKFMVLFAKLAGPIAEALDPLFGLLEDVFPVIQDLMPVISAALKFAFAPLIATFKLVTGIVKIFKGDFMEGLKSIGESIMRTIGAPFMFVWDMISGFWPGLTDGILSVGGKIFDAITWPFKKAWDWIAGWFVGESPSKLGEGILDGIASIGSMLFDALTWPFRKVADFIGNIFGVDNIGTTITDGIKEAGSAVYDAVTYPFKAAADFVGDALGSVADFFGFGGDDKETQAKKVNDATIAPDGGLVVSGAKGTYQLNKDDTVVAGTDLNSKSDDSGSILGDIASVIASPMEAFGSMVNTSSNNAEVVSLLKELIAKVDQPVQIKFGTRVIDEIDKQATLRRGYATKIDNTYGRI